MKSVTLSFVILALLLPLSLPAQSAEKAGIFMDDVQMIDDTPLQINGIALREKFVFDVYVAGLYLDTPSDNAKDILSRNGHRMMIMHFVRDVGGDKINEAWYEGLEANVDPITPGLKAKFDQLAGMMEDIKENQAMSFTYVPTKGTTVMVNGKNKGTISGKDFADAILATWIGPTPGPGADFKAALLGQ